jgi:hypothetical protein
MKRSMESGNSHWASEVRRLDDKEALEEEVIRCEDSVALDLFAELENRHGNLSAPPPSPLSKGRDPPPPPPSPRKEVEETAPLAVILQSSDLLPILLNSLSKFSTFYEGVQSVDACRDLRLLAKGLKLGSNIGPAVRKIVRNMCNDFGAECGEAIYKSAKFNCLGCNRPEADGGPCPSQKHHTCLECTLDPDWEEVRDAIDDARRYDARARRHREAPMTD